MQKKTGVLVYALRRTERVLLAGGQLRARRNAWSAVVENRQHAADRAEVAGLFPAEADGQRRHA
ncbi:hypothetical protein ACWCYY_20165 [Kitasatospora sp. NPDC001664]|uniref:hypothetical protein n=1 Tax=Kitasatospora sp. NPDC051853 TaxID=3364058 RepID=UPI0037AAF7B9